VIPNIATSLRDISSPQQPWTASQLFLRGFLGHLAVGAQKLPGRGMIQGLEKLSKDSKICCDSGNKTGTKRESKMEVDQQTYDTYG
jgi:hypothetical protein